MKIGHIDSKATSSVTPSTERRGAAGKPATAEPSAKVELSAASSLQGGADQATFDKAKVDRIATAIREGRFQVNAEAIADKLIANAQELVGRSQN